jgi:hypothetical protein
VKDVTFGQQITLKDGSVEVNGCASLEEARLKVLTLAVAAGYKRPGWWARLTGAVDYFRMFGLSEEDLNFLRPAKLLKDGEGER